jgi:GAF domain-containing protein
VSLTRYKAVADMATAISSSTEYEDVLTTVAEQAAGAFEVFECGIYVSDPDAGTATAVALWSQVRTPDDDAYLGTPIALDAQPAMTRSLRDGEMVETRLNDMSLLDVDRRFMEEWGEMSVLWVPLFFGKEIIGCLELIEKRYIRPFTDYDREFAATVAALAAMAIHTARTRRLLEAQERKLEVLLGASRELAAAVNEQEVLESIARTTGRALRADACFIYLYEPEFETVSWVATWQLDPSSAATTPDAEGTTYRLSDYPADYRALTEGIVVERRVSDPALSDPERQDLAKWGFKTVLTVPAIVDGVPVGQLEVTNVQTEYVFDADELELARALGEQAAVALKRRASRGAVGIDERPELE